MTLEQFRVIHSTLLEHYQFIEAHLEGIYAVISGKGLLVGLSDVEKANLRQIIGEIQKLEVEREMLVFTKEELQQLEKIFRRRNFWCHNCYCDLIFDVKTGGLKKASDIKCMTEDLREAELWRERLYNKKMDLFE